MLINYIYTIMISNLKDDKLILIEYTYKENKLRVLKTITKMLIYRNIVSENFETIYSKFVESLKNDETVAYYKKDDEITYAVKFINKDIVSSSKNPDINTFINSENERDKYKFIIVNDIVPKYLNSLRSVKNTEIFLLREVLENLIDHDLVPKKQRILNKEEIIQFKNDYNPLNKDMPRILINDPCARYLNAKENDIIEIIRHDPMSGFCATYRLVVPGFMV